MEAHMSTGGLGKRSAAQPSTRYISTVNNNCKPNMNAAVCSVAPLLTMMGMICTMMPVFGIRRNAVPTVRFQNAQERNAWRILYSCGGRQAGGDQRWRRVAGGRGES